MRSFWGFLFGTHELVGCLVTASLGTVESKKIWWNCNPTVVGGAGGWIDDLCHFLISSIRIRGHHWIITWKNDPSTKGMHSFHEKTALGVSTSMLSNHQKESMPSNHQKPVASMHSSPSVPNSFPGLTGSPLSGPESRSKPTNIRVSITQIAQRYSRVAQMADAQHTYQRPWRAKICHGELNCWSSNHLTNQKTTTTQMVLCWWSW